MAYFPLALPMNRRVDQTVRQCKYEQRAAEIGVARQIPVTPDRAQSRCPLREAGSHADAGPAAYTRVDTDVLFAWPVENSASAFQMKQLRAATKSQRRSPDAISEADSLSQFSFAAEGV